MNAAAAHKDELQKLLEDLSSDTLVSGITFAALVDAYVTRLDANCPDISRRANPLSTQIAGELTYGTNIDPKLRALLRATQNFEATRSVFPKISRCGPQANARSSSEAAARRTFPAATAFPGQRPLTDVNQWITRRIGRNQ